MTEDVIIAAMLQALGILVTAACYDIPGDLHWDTKQQVLTNILCAVFLPVFWLYLLLKLLSRIPKWWASLPDTNAKT